MAVPEYIVTVDGTTISNVQEWSFTRGVQALSDSIRAGTGYIRGRRPDLLPTIEIGQDVQIGTTVNGTFIYARVADFRIEYGEVAALDTWEIDIEDAIAALGRATTSFVWTAGSSTSSAMSTVITNAGVTPYVQLATTSTCSAQVIINENALEVFGRLMTQEQGFYIAGGFDNSILLYGRGFPSALTEINFSDDGTGTNPIEYNELRFLGLADNYANNIIVEAAGLAQQSSGTGTYSAIFQTYNQTTGAADDLADYLLGVYDAQVQTPGLISAQWQGQTVAGQAGLVATYMGPAVIKIKFRTNTYYGVVIGATATGLIDNILFTYYLAAPGFFTAFTLDSLTSGVLNTNRLGY